MNFKKLFRTYSRLGTLNVLRVFLYRVTLKMNMHPVQRIAAPIAKGPFYRYFLTKSRSPKPNSAWRNNLVFFGRVAGRIPEKPVNWFLNSFNRKAKPTKTEDWWKISDFSSGDIKGVWEISRFDWVIAWATEGANGDSTFIDRLNIWIDDWATQNVPYKGTNWKCGQEASIRVIHLVTAAWVLRQDKSPEQGLICLIQTHLQRIIPTISYAIGQQNNHGTTEAAALFIGGIFLEDYDERASFWEQTGRKWLEDRASSLIAVDGSFSQYSVNYHRFMLDTYSIAEAWRRHRKAPEFSSSLKKRLAAAAYWLFTIVDPISGDAPNLGANDGARLIPLTACDYRDFRPSVQLALALFNNASAFPDSKHAKTLLKWLGVTQGALQLKPKSKNFSCGGYHVMRLNNSMAVMRYPQYKFRPSHADALHVDFWLGGMNILRDAGTFSYNDNYTEWFAGTSAHNTIEFDGRDQMPRIGRFLFGDWLQSSNVNALNDDVGFLSSSAAYKDYLGACHSRELTLEKNSVTCTDNLNGNFKEACLRWRLAPIEWRFSGNILYSNKCSIEIQSNGLSVTPQLKQTMESRYYLEFKYIPELSVIVKEASTIKTFIKF